MNSFYCECLRHNLTPSRRHPSGTDNTADWLTVAHESVLLLSVAGSGLQNLTWVVGDITARCLCCSCKRSQTAYYYCTVFQTFFTISDSLSTSGWISAKKNQRNQHSFAMCSHVLLLLPNLSRMPIIKAENIRLNNMPVDKVAFKMPIIY